MSTDLLPDGPSLDEMIQLLCATFPDAAIARTENAIFFSLDDKHWPNFATIVWSDEFDEGAPSNLVREGVYRVNVGVDRATFERMVGSRVNPDYAAFDSFMPNPTYAKQRWISVINPSHATVGDTLMPLVSAARDRLIAQRPRQARAGR